MNVDGMYYWINKMGGRLVDGQVKCQEIGGSLFIAIPKTIATYNKLHKGSIIVWSMDRGFPHIQKIIDEHEIICQNKT